MTTINVMKRNQQPITTFRRDLLNLLKKPMFPERSIRVLREAKNAFVSDFFDLQSVVIAKQAMVVKKLLVDENITACVKQKKLGLLGVIKF